MKPVTWWYQPRPTTLRRVLTASDLARNKARKIARSASRANAAVVTVMAATAVTATMRRQKARRKTLRSLPNIQRPIRLYPNRNLRQQLLN